MYSNSIVEDLLYVACSKVILMGSPVSGIQVLLTCMVGVSMLDWRMTADIFTLVSSVKPWPEILIFLSRL